MKNYVVKNLRGELKVISPRGFIPEDVLCEAPSEYDFNLDSPECLTIDESSGSPVASVDTIKQGEMRAERAQVKLEREEARPMNDLRSKRNSLLAQSDWTELSSRRKKMTPAEKKAWDEYRDALRDLPENADPKNPQWPQKPE